MTPPEVLRTPSVTLRRWRTPWEDELVAAVRASTLELTKFMPWVVDDYGVEQAREYLARSTADWEADESWNYAIFEPNGHLVGSCGLMTRMGPGVLEIGYWVHSDYTGLGYATAAATALAEIGLATQGIDRIAIKTDIANTASGRVAEKAGFTKVGVEHDEPDAPGDSGENIIWERELGGAAASDASAR